MTENERILALEEIKKLKARYFRTLDTKDWAGYLGVFTQDAIIDSTEAYTPKDLNGTPIVFDGEAPPAPNPEWHSGGDPARFIASPIRLIAILRRTRTPGVCRSWQTTGLPDLWPLFSAWSEEPERAAALWPRQRLAPAVSAPPPQKTAL